MTARFSAKVIDALLAGLSTDPEFREAFSHDPRAALLTLGHETPKEDFEVVGRDPVMCCYPATLASMEQLSASRQMLREQLQSQNPFMSFEAE